MQCNSCALSASFFSASTRRHSAHHDLFFAANDFCKHAIYPNPTHKYTPTAPKPVPAGTGESSTDGGGGPARPRPRAGGIGSRIKSMQGGVRSAFRISCLLRTVRLRMHSSPPFLLPRTLSTPDRFRFSLPYDTPSLDLASAALSVLLPPLRRYISHLCGCNAVVMSELFFNFVFSTFFHLFLFLFLFL